MPKLHDSGVGAETVADGDDLAILWVNGSVALDTQARAAIKSALEQVGVKCTSERVLSAHPSASSSAGVGSSLSQSPTPRLALLASTAAGTEEALEEVLTQKLTPVFGKCFSISTDMFEIASLFPPLPSHERATTESKDSDLPPDHERRVFTFDNDEEALILGGNNDISHQADEGEDDEDNDIVAEQLVAIPRSPLPGHIKTTLAQFLPASVSSRIAPEGAEDSKLVGQNILQRPTSAFRARKVPSSVSAPTIQPRLSKAAALRMGMELPERKAARSEVDVAEEVFVPGTMRRAVTPPKSLSKPTLAPRQNRASALRTTEGTEKEDSSTRPATKRRESVGTSQRSAGFEGLPGFAKRPVQPPSLPKSDMVTAGPVQNRTSLLRQKSQEGYLAQIAKPTQRRQSLTTAERAAAFARTRASLDERAASRGGTLRSHTPSEASTSRADLSRESPVDENVKMSAVTAALAGTSFNPARSPSIVPRPNKAAELRLAAQKAGKA